jgi:hypothetical protein
MFHFAPDTQYLLMTVILMEARQYAAMEMAGLFVICDTGIGRPPFPVADAGLRSGDKRPLPSGISIEKSSSLFLSSIVATVSLRCESRVNNRVVVQCYSQKSR